MSVFIIISTVTEPHGHASLGPLAFMLALTPTTRTTKLRLRLTATLSPLHRTSDLRRCGDLVPPTQAHSQWCQFPHGPNRMLKPQLLAPRSCRRSHLSPSVHHSCLTQSVSPRAVLYNCTVLVATVHSPQPQSTDHGPSLPSLLGISIVSRCVPSSAQSRLARM